MATALPDNMNEADNFAGCLGCCNPMVQGCPSLRSPRTFKSPPAFIKACRIPFFSRTVIASTVMDADALATAVFVMGPEKGMALVDSLEGVEAMMITESGLPLYTKNFEAQLGFVLHDIEDNSSR